MATPTANPMPSRPRFRNLRMCREEQCLNPFRSERLRPGTIPFLFPEGTCIEDLIETLRRSRWRGEIVGPHGTGKSTLVQALLAELTSRGHNISYGCYAGGQPKWRALSAERPDDTGERTQPNIVVIDGFEQLSAISRWCWRWWTSLRRCGLLVTAHRSIGLPCLYQTKVTANVASQVVRRIAGNDLGGFSNDDIVDALGSTEGNMRDALFLLYDQFEERRHL